MLFLTGRCQRSDVRSIGRPRLAAVPDPMLRFPDRLTHIQASAYKIKAFFLTTSTFYGQQTTVSRVTDLRLRDYIMKCLPCLIQSTMHLLHLVCMEITRPWLKMCMHAGQVVALCTRPMHACGAKPTHMQGSHQKSLLCFTCTQQQAPPPIGGTCLMSEILAAAGTRQGAIAVQHVHTEKYYYFSNILKYSNKTIATYR